MSLETLLSDGETTAPVAVAVLAHDLEALPRCLEAVDRQVYGPAARYVVGGGDEGRRMAVERDVPWVPGTRELPAALADDVVFVWMVDSRARPRPDALRSLVVESFRVDASVAGSKILDAAQPDRLDSVGMATDVFQAPYTGLDPDELDQQQYEVVRDVATVSPASVLVRRDLLRGLGGLDPAMAPAAAVTDLSQRARLRGARVVVVPSSEVLYPAPDRRATVPWHEEASRLRGAAKAYSPLTLLWVLPTAVLVSLIEAVTAPLLGRWTLFNLVRALVWNVAYLPSTLQARWHARRGRVVGDEELFRYQVRGSARLREVAGDIGDQIRERLPETEGRGFAGLVEVGAETVRSPNFIVGLVVVVWVLLATRSIWSGTLPAVGFALPPSESAMDTLRAYAGGWNVAGLGSPAPLHPSVGVVAVAQRVLFDRPDLTAAVLTIAALGAGAVGMGRLLRSWRIHAPAAYLAGIAYVGGPAVQSLAGRAEWTALFGLGLLPWVLRVALRPWPRSLRGRLGLVAAVALLTGLMAAGLPALLPAPAAALALWALLGRGKRWWAPLRAAGGAVLGAMLLFPWFGVVGLEEYVEAGSPAWWEVWWPMVAVVAGTGLAVAVGARDRVLAALAGWGLTLGAGGLALARAATLDAGRDLAAAGMVLAALGTGAIVGAALEGFSRLEALNSWRQVLTAVGLVGGAMLVAATLLLAGPGRAGLPEDEYRRALRFTTAQGDATLARVLIAGPAEELPGESRLLDGAAYRVVSAPVPRLWEARLAAPRLADEELEATLRSIIAGDVARAGEALAPFGIRWIVILEPSPFEDVFDAQLDLIPLSGLDRPVFLSEVDAVRARSDAGDVWVWDPPDYRGEARPGARVFVAENADQRWGPAGWEQADWGNSVAAAEPVIRFGPHGPFRRQALAGGGLAAFFLAVAIWGSGRRAR